jgi:hypothetical protein
MDTALNRLQIGWDLDLPEEASKEKYDCSVQRLVSYLQSYEQHSP